MPLFELKQPELEFGALLTYAPKNAGDSPGMPESRSVMDELKKDGYVLANNQQVPIKEWIASEVKRGWSSPPYSDFFKPTTTLIPTPAHSETKEGALWVPERLANALLKAGLGKEVSTCLWRIKPVQKAGTSASMARPTVEQHYESMAVRGGISPPSEILLVDDVVTQGRTLIGAANRLRDRFPKTPIRAFAAMRAMSRSDQPFRQIVEPCVGKITYYPERGGYIDRTP